MADFRRAGTNEEPVTLGALGLSGGHSASLIPQACQSELSRGLVRSRQSHLEINEIKANRGPKWWIFPEFSGPGIGIYKNVIKFYSICSPDSQKPQKDNIKNPFS